MLDKIIVSADRKSARIYFAADITQMQPGDGAYHSVGVFSDENVLILLWELIFEPAIRLEELAKEREARFLASLEDTVEIEINSLKDVA